jgi:hypothetical protein
MLYEMIVGMTPFYDGIVDQVGCFVRYCLMVISSPHHLFTDRAS